MGLYELVTVHIVLGGVFDGGCRDGNKREEEEGLEKEEEMGNKILLE